MDLEALCQGLLTAIGEDPQREGLLKTPERFARAFTYLTRGYEMKPEDVIADAIFTEETSQNLVLVRNIEFYSLCEHHMLPFFGRAHVAYIPNGKIVGISKLARLCEVFSRRLQVQERLTQQLAECLMEHLQPLGVAVVMEAHHLCMMMRGVEKQASSTITSSMLGTFRTNASSRSELLSLIRGSER